MVLFVGVELTSGGRAARKSAVSATDYGVSLRTQWKTAEAQRAGRDIPAVAAPLNDNPQAERTPKTRELAGISRPPNATTPQKKSALNAPNAKVVLGPQLETEQSCSEPETGRDHRVPAHVTGARPSVEILPEPEPSPVETRLASIQQNLDRLLRAVAAQSQRETTIDPARQAAELLKQLRQERALDQLTSRQSKLDGPEADDENADPPNRIDPDRKGADVKLPRDKAPPPVEPEAGREMPLFETDEKPKKRRLLTKIYRPRYLSGSSLQSLIEPLLTSEVGKAGAADAGTDDSALAAGGDRSPATASIVVVHDYPDVLRKVDRLVLELDVPPVPLVIEATVITVRLNGGMPYGIDLQEFNSPGQPFFVSPVDGLAPGADMAGGRATVVDEAKMPPIGEGPILTHGLGLKCGVLRGDPRAFLSALEAAAQTRFARAWQMNVLNRQSAQLMLNDPFGPEGSVAQAAAGTILKIRPIITRNGLIHLDVRREVDLDAAVSGSRSAALTNQFVLQDGETALVGGYYAEHLAAHFYRPPGIAQTPLLGRLFRRQAGAIERSETIVLLTPHMSQPSAPTPVEQPTQVSERPILKQTAGGQAADAQKPVDAPKTVDPPRQEEAVRPLDERPAAPAPPAPAAKPSSAEVPAAEPPRRLPEAVQSRPIIRPAGQREPR